MICDNKNKKELNKEAPLMMNTMEIAKKIIISSEEHGEFDWILLANSTRLSMETRQYPTGILPLGSMLWLEELSVNSTAIFSTTPKQCAAESVHSQHNLQQ